MRRLLLAALVALTPVPVYAQTAATPGQGVTEGAQIDDAIARAARRHYTRDDPYEGDGEGGLYILDTPRLFYVAGNAGVGYHSNPLRTSDDAGSSGSFDAALSAGLRTRIGERVDLGLNVDVSGTKYFRSFAPSSTAASTSLTLGTPIGQRLYVGAVAFGGYNFDDVFDRKTGFYGGSVFASGAIPLARRLVLQPSISATRQWTGISENDNIGATSRLALVFASGRLTASLGGSFGRVWFDDYYEDVTFVRRRDWQYEGVIAAGYALTPALQLAASARYVRRDSTFFLASYKGVDSQLGVAITQRF